MRVACRAGLSSLATTLLLLLVVLDVREVRAFAVATKAPPSSSPRTVKTGKKDGAAARMDAETLPFRTKDVVKRVAVAGATGRTGRYVVEELLKRGVEEVVAVVRDTDKANEVFTSNPESGMPSNLEVVRCDLTSEKEIESVLKGADAAIWCATGFSDSDQTSPFEKVKRLLGVALTPKKTIDAVGVPCVGRVMMEAPESQKANGDAANGEKGQPSRAALPKVVMLSSAGVTRPAWDEEKKQRFRGAADIPIVRLNPFGILDIKRESEERLRATGVDYCIVRPAGLNDKWPAGSRPILSQGDVAAGRINRKDVASILVDALSTPEAVGKTFEVITLSGYPRGMSIGPALRNFRRDDEGPPSLETVAATYSTMQQLLPGERQDSAGLAMGQTYEQLDAGQEGRFGERGKEDIDSAAPKPTN